MLPGSITPTIGFGQTAAAMVKPLREAAERLICYPPMLREYCFINQ